MSPWVATTDYLRTMADGTVKQINPFTGTQVWTVPGRGNRPLGVATPNPQPLDPAQAGAHCAFCERRYLETPPEKARLVRRGEVWELLRGLPAEELTSTVAEFRRIPNLFEILSYDYWHDNYGFELPAAVAERKREYLESAAGRAHALAVVGNKLRASGMSAAEVEAMSEDERLAQASGFFGGGHDVIVGRRHYADGATDTSQLASSGTLTSDEHEQYVRLTVDTMASLYDTNRYARYVAVFQNWLKPAGASFDHLHKQAVAIDERGPRNEATLPKLRANPNLFNEAAVNYAGYHNLVVAENDHAIAFAGFGHRYPTVEIYSTSEESNPWDHSAEEVRGMSDLVHAVHAATGPSVPCNEEWHHRPIDVPTPMPWRVMVKWRVSTLAGFEGGTQVYLNTISPQALRDRLVPELERLRAAGWIGQMRIGVECRFRPNPLRCCR